MIRVTGRWKARVEQDFEIEVDSRSEIQAAIDDEMSPGKVVELLDFEFEIESEDEVE